MEAGVPPPAAPAAPAAAAPHYPIRYDVEYTEEGARLTTFFRYFMVIPQAFVLFFVGLIAGIMVFLAWFAILFTGRYPRGMFDFVIKYMRWAWNVNSYLFLMRDEYPPFNGEPGGYPVHVDIDYPDHQLSRVTTFFRYIMAIPQLFVLAFVGLLNILVVAQWFSIVFTGKRSQGMFDLLVGVHRWQIRVIGYLYLVTDKYPPFSLE